MLLRNCVRQQSRTATSKSAVRGWIAMTIWNLAVADRRRLRPSKTTCATGCFVNTIPKQEKRDGPGITMRSLSRSRNEAWKREGGVPC